MDRTCTPCAGCVDADGACRSGGSNDDCGGDGGACVACESTSTCTGGTCAPCAGCIDDAGQCQLGIYAAACGMAGSACAACGGTAVCYDGSCCQPNCSGKVCGPDGCGGSCAPGCTSSEFAAGNVCNSQGLCVGVMEIAAGGNTTCAVMASGPPQCWGQNSAGQLGNGTYTDSPLPTPVSLASALWMTVGQNFACALTTTGGAMECWGANAFGELGDGQSGASSATPVSVAGSTGYATVVAGAGSMHVCEAYPPCCWGANGFGQLGDGTTTNSDFPIAVSDLSQVFGVAVGAQHTCAAWTDGRSPVLSCWGDGLNGQLGDGKVENSSLPVQVSNLSSSGYQAMAAGVSHTCAAVGSSVWCWGSNASGQLGNGTTQDSDEPVQIPAFTGGASALAAGYNHTCAIAGTTVYCWGDNSNGQLGDGTTTTRTTPVTAISSGAIQIAAGESHTCALLTDELLCWGLNSNGQLGNGTQVDSWRPVSVVLH